MNCILCIFLFIASNAIIALVVFEKYHMHSDMTYVRAYACVRTWKTDKILCTHKLLPLAEAGQETTEHVRVWCFVLFIGKTTDLKYRICYKVRVLKHFYLLSNLSV